MRLRAGRAGWRVNKNHPACFLGETDIKICTQKSVLCAPLVCEFSRSSVELFDRCIFGVNWPTCDFATLL